MQKGKKKKEDTATVTAGVPNAVQVPQHVSSQTPLRPLGIVEGPAPSPIMHRKVTTAENAKGPQTRPCEVLGGSRRRSMCVVESTGDGMTESTILKPRTGAGVTKKKTVVRSLRSGGVGGVKAKGGMGGCVVPTTATDEGMAPPPTKTSPEVLHGQRRRSLRIIESTKKAASEKGESAATGLDKGKEVVRGGFRG